MASPVAALSPVIASVLSASGPTDALRRLGECVVAHVETEAGGAQKFQRKTHLDEDERNRVKKETRKLDDE